MNYKITASVLGPPPQNIQSEEKIKEASDFIDKFQIDHMDGQYIDRKIMGPETISFLKNLTDKPIEAHLMARNPNIEKWIEADSIIVHFSACDNIIKKLEEIKMYNLIAGVAFNPDEKIQNYGEISKIVDMFLCMTVIPGKSGQSFDTRGLDNIRFLRENGWRGDIEVDGGINDTTIKDVLNAGANDFVSASYLFNGNIKENVKKFREALK